MLSSFALYPVAFFPPFFNKKAKRLLPKGKMACVNAATVVLLLGKQIDEFSKKSWYAKFTTTQLSLTEGDVTLDD